MILFAKLYMDHVNTTTTTTNTIDELTVMTNTLESLKKNLTALHYESDFTRANKMPGGNITAIDHEIVRTKRDIVAVSFQIAEANHEMRIKNSLRKTRGYRGSNHMVTAKKPRKVTVDPLRMAMLERARMKIDDKHLDKLAYYMIRDATNISMLLTARGIENTAALNVAAKGFYVVASSQSGSSDALDEHKVIGLDKEPFHSFYRYTHKYADPCLLHYISLKYDPDCGDSLGTRYIRPLLIVSVQRSGSHYAWEMLNRLGIHVHHEGIGPDGAVSWLYAINANTLRLRVPPRAGRPHRGRNYIPSSNTTTTAAAAAADTIVPASGRWKDSPTYGTFGIFVRTGYAINNPEKISVHRFRVVLHQVRHPLRVINTIVKRCPSWDKFWRWIAYARGMQGITKNQSPLRRAMLLYILWNKHIERYADIRFKSETTSPKTICLLGGFKERCNGTSGSDAQIIEPVNEPENEEEGEEGEEGEEEGEVAEEGQEEVGKDSPGQTPIPISSTQLNVTWTDIEKEDKQLANELKIMCVEYGYDLDPDKIPQNEDTKQFTA